MDRNSINWLDVAQESTNFVPSVDDFARLFAGLTPRQVNSLFRMYALDLAVPPRDFLMVIDLLANYDKNLYLHETRWDVSKQEYHDIVFSTLQQVGPKFEEVLCDFEVLKARPNL